MKTKISQFVAAALLTAVTATSAHAGFVGRTLNATYFASGLVTPYASATATPSTFTVGSGVETIMDVEGVTKIAVDFTDTGVSFVFTTTLTNPTWNSGAFNGIVFDLVAGDPLSLTLPIITSSTFLGDFDAASRVGISDNQLTIDWNGLSYVNGTSLLINLTSAPASVPEPGSLALMGVALAALAYRTRQKRDAKAVSGNPF